jgi:putative hydrolase of the HAD superfamily
MSIKVVLFDLDETLFDRTNSLIAFLASQHARFGKRLGDVTFAEWRDHFLLLDDRGRASKANVYPAILARFGGDAAAAPELLADYQAYCCRHARANEGMEETLRALRDRGLALGIVTNGQTEFQNRHIDALQLRPLVDAIFISEAEGLRKPDPALFHRAAERLNTTARDCLFVGDDPVNDILGAHRAGMRTAWIRDGRDWPEAAGPMPGIAIDRLPQVLALVGKTA